MSRFRVGITTGLSRLNTALFGPSNRIARRLIVFIIVFSSLITLLISAIQLTLEYRELRSGIDRQFDAINLNLPNITASVWDFDERQIQLALDALIQQPNIEFAAVVTPEHSKRWSAGEGTSNSVVTRTYRLRNESRGEQTEIGQLEVTASLTSIYWKVAERAASIILSNAVKTFMVAFFTLFLFRRLVTRRLEELALKVGKLVPDALSSAGTQHEAQPMPANLDELQSVEWVLDQTIDKLGAASAALTDLNQELADQVVEKEALLQNVLVGIVMLRDREIVSCNRRFEQMFGYETGSMIGQSTRILFPSEQAWADFGEVAYDTLACTSRFASTTLMVKRGGTQFWAEIAGSAVASDRPFAESIWIFSDVTERKQMEAKMVMLQANLWKTLETQLVRHTVAALAHEVNQPLGSISALCEAAQRMLVSGCGAGATAETSIERLKHVMQRMAAESERAGRMVRHLMETLHMPIITVEPTVLSSAIHDAARNATSCGLADCEIIIDCTDDMEPVLVNRQQLEKVLLNLIGNASEAMCHAGTTKGRVWISAGVDNDGVNAHVTVRDEGPGVSKEMETQIFHPFITTKPRNLGMGLAISRSLIEALGGAFWLTTDHQPGAIFHFTLPIAS